MDLSTAQRTDCPDCRGTGLVATPSLEECRTQVVCTCPTGDAYGKPGAVYGGNTHSMTYVEHDGKIAMVDVGIAEDVLTLWKAGIDTWVSCEGGPDCSWPRYISIINPDQRDEARALLPWVTEEVDRTDQPMHDYIFFGDA